MLNETLLISPWQWVIAAVGALLIGVSKTGMAGLGILFVALFAAVFPSTKQASGIVLPLLIFGDLIAVYTYRRHLQWSQIWRLFPWTAVGVVAGYLTLGHISDRTARSLIGAIILTMAALSYWPRMRGTPTIETRASLRRSAAAAIGVLAGFTTLIANAAGPLMAIYLLAMRLPKLEYVGMAAIFFCLLNLFKLPFMMNLGLVTSASAEFNLLLAPFVLVGALAGRWLISRINQRLFEELVLGLSAVAGVLLLL
jgi:uncharacterized membrane protein YfcA